jgi:hypothetical protein
MAAATPSIGETGLQSIRVNGLRINELPIAELHEATQQLRLAEDDFRQARIKSVMATYPPYQVSALKSQIRTSKSSILRAQAVIDKENQTINDYVGHVAVCERRDQELKDLGVELEKL